ncbi:MAG: alpha/beta hydrolase [Turneriella sp.]|nr:alpha/beta hydrolase [Turneriella sp.]
MHVERYGPSSAPRLVFLHGYGAHPRFYRDFLEAAAAKFCVLVPELFGLAGVCRRDFKENLALLRQALLPARHEPIVVVGHSYGALVALHLATEMPQLKKVVAVNPLLPQSLAPEKLRQQTKKLARDLMHHTGELRSLVANFPVGLQYGLNLLRDPAGYVEGALRALSTTLPQKSSPVAVDVVYAELDTLFPLDQKDLKPWQALLPQLRFVSIPNYSHNWLIYHGRQAWEKIAALL